MSMPNPYNKYLQTQVQTAPPEQLVTMLYDGAIRFGMQSIEAIRRNDAAAAHTDLLKVQNILHELIVSLNSDAGEIAEQLYQLYDYLLRRSMEANVKKDAAIVEEVLQFLRELRGTWAEAIILARRQQLRAGVGDGGNF